MVIDIQPLRDILANQAAQQIIITYFWFFFLSHKVGV